MNMEYLLLHNHLSDLVMHHIFTLSKVIAFGQIPTVLKCTYSCRNQWHKNSPRRICVAKTTLAHFYRVCFGCFAIPPQNSETRIPPCRTLKLEYRLEKFKTQIPAYLYLLRLQLYAMLVSFQCCHAAKTTDDVSTLRHRLPRINNLYIYKFLLLVFYWNNNNNNITTILLLW